MYLLWATVVVAGCLGGTAEVDLLADSHFRQGLNVCSPAPGAHVVQRELLWGDDGDKPVWRLSQWHSHFTLAEGKLTRTVDGSWGLRDAAKWVYYDTGDADLILGLDSRVEYGDRYRKQGEMWPHLLVGCNVTDACPRLDAIAAMPYAVECRLDEADTFREDGYDPHIHAAQFLGFFTIQNHNRASEGYGDFLWLGVPLYDDRGRTGRAVINGDVDLKKLIYTPQRSAYTDQPVKVGVWIRFAADLLPLAKEALETAWERGYLQESKDLGDYRVGGVSLGWEVTGRNRVSVSLRNLSLKAVLKEE